MTTKHARAGLMLLLAALGITGLVSPSAADRTAEPFEYKKTLAPGKTLTIVGINGYIRAEPTSGTEVEVDAERRGKRSDPTKVRIEVTEDADGIWICALYPQRNGDYGDCDSQQNLKNNDVRVEFDVKVPKGVTLDARTVNGEIEARDLAGPVRGATVNGGVELSTTSWAKATTVNGSIRAAIRRLDAKDLEFSTVNGSITLEVPPGLDARLLATTVNGSIDTEIPVTVNGRLHRQHLEGTIGRGGPEIRASTVNGSISLLSALAD